jgi:hypothetical protein
MDADPTSLSFQNLNLSIMLIVEFLQCIQAAITLVF